MVVCPRRRIYREISKEEEIRETVLRGGALGGEEKKDLDDSRIQDVTAGEDKVMGITPKPGGSAYPSRERNLP